MSQAPHCSHLRGGVKMGDLKMVDTMIKDGLLDAFNGYHMGITAENVAKKWQISREQQDEFAAASQNKAGGAKAGSFKDEIMPVTIKTGKGRRWSSTRRASAARHHARGAGQAAAGVQQGRHGDRRQRVRASTTAPPRSC